MMLVKKRCHSESRSDEEPAFPRYRRKSRFLAPLGMKNIRNDKYIGTRFGTAGSRALM
jgi:hypothetical protein